MATQRFTIATLSGQAALSVASTFEWWRAAPEPIAVDRLCAAVRGNALSLAVVYFAEWVDRWLMGDTLPDARVQGRSFEAACFTREEVYAWAARCGGKFPEQEWLACRLREAAGAGAVSGHAVVIVFREVVGPSATVEELRQATEEIPSWLTSQR